MESMSTALAISPHLLRRHIDMNVASVVEALGPRCDIMTLHIGADELTRYVRSRLKLVRLTRYKEELDPIRYGLGLLPMITSPQYMQNLLVLTGGKLLATHWHNQKDEVVVGISGTALLSWGEVDEWVEDDSLNPRLGNMLQIEPGVCHRLKPRTQYWIRALRGNQPWIGLESSTLLGEQSVRRPEGVAVVPYYERNQEFFAEGAYVT